MTPYLLAALALATFTILPIRRGHSSRRLHVHQRACRHNKTKLEHGHGFEFVYSPNIDLNYSQLIATHTTYSACASKRAHQIHYQSKLPPTTHSLAASTHLANQSLANQSVTENSSSSNPARFSAERFLAILKGKTLLILGDSLGEQAYGHLFVDLLPYETNLIIGNGTHDWNSVYNGEKTKVAYPKKLAAQHFYSHNTTILWCRDSMAAPWLNRDVDFFCTHAFLRRADVLFLSMGSHFKPGVQADRFSTTTLEQYYHLVEQQAAVLENHIAKFLLWMSLEKLFPVIIWRLDGHVGAVDEYNLFYQKGDPGWDIYGDHLNKKNQWERLFERSTRWVTEFNTVRRVIASARGDLIFPTDIMSQQLFAFETDRLQQLAKASNKTNDLAFQLEEGIQFHVDSLHYCAGGGLLRAGNLVLQRLLEHESRCRLGPRGSDFSADGGAADGGGGSGYEFEGSGHRGGGGSLRGGGGSGSGSGAASSGSRPPSPSPKA